MQKDNMRGCSKYTLRQEHQSIHGVRVVVERHTNDVLNIFVFDNKDHLCIHNFQCKFIRHKQNRLSMHTCKSIFRASEYNSVLEIVKIPMLEE